jgi:hypothetical protein
MSEYIPDEACEVCRVELHTKCVPWGVV